MVIKILIALLLTTTACFATTYYISSSTGNNTNTGLSTDQALYSWPGTVDGTIYTLACGDSVLFKRGDEWRGTNALITIPAALDCYGSGGFTFGAYGTSTGTLGAGNRPLFSGAVTARDLSQTWVNDSGAIWYIDGVTWAGSGSNSPVRIVIDLDNINHKYDTEPISESQTTGSGKDDVSSWITANTSGFNDYATATYEATISTTGTPDKWKWRKNGGSWSSEISMSTTATDFGDNVYIDWGSTTGHTLNDVWTIVAQPKVSLGGNLIRVTAKASMYANTYYFDDTNNKLYVWLDDGLEPGLDQIFIGRSGTQYRGLITTNDASTGIDFQDLEIRFSNSSGLSIPSPNNTAERVWGHHNTNADIVTAVYSPSFGDNFTCTDCWSSFSAGGTVGHGGSQTGGPSGTSQPITFEGSNNWCYNCISTYSYKAGFDWLSYSTAPSSSGGCVNCKAYRNGFCSDPGMYIDGAIYVSIINSVSLAQGHVINGPDTCDVGWNRNAIETENENDETDMKSFTLVNSLANSNNNPITLRGDVDNYYIYGNTSYASGNSVYTGLALAPTTGAKIYMRGNIFQTTNGALGRSWGSTVPGKFWGNYNVYRSALTSNIFEVNSDYITMAEWQALLSNGAGYEDENSIGGGTSGTTNPRFTTLAGVYTFPKLLVNSATGAGLDETELVDYGSYFLENVADGGANTSPAIGIGEDGFWRTYIYPYNATKGTTSVLLTTDSEDSWDIGFHYGVTVEAGDALNEAYPIRINGGNIRGFSAL